MKQILGDRLKALREEKKISQEDLALALGISRLSVGNYERSVRTPEAETIIKMANYFNTTTDYLLGVSDFRMRAEEGSQWQDMLVSSVTNDLAKFFNAYNDKLKPIEDEDIYKVFYLAILGSSKRTIGSCLELIDELSEIQNLDVDKIENVVDGFMINFTDIRIRSTNTKRLFSASDMFGWIRAWIDERQPEYASYRKYLDECAAETLDFDEF